MTPSDISRLDYYQRIWTNKNYAEWSESGKEYFDNWNKKFKLKCQIIIPHPLEKNIWGRYMAHGRQIKHDYLFGEILIDVEKHPTKEELFHTIRHEIAHALCDLRYNDPPNHGWQWIKIAKLLRVNTVRYEKELKKYKTTLI